MYDFCDPSQREKILDLVEARLDFQVCTTKTKEFDDFISIVPVATYRQEYSNETIYSVLYYSLESQGYQKETKENYFLLRLKQSKLNYNNHSYSITNLHGSIKKSKNEWESTKNDARDELLEMMCNRKEVESYAMIHKIGRFIADFNVRRKTKDMLALIEKYRIDEHRKKREFNSLRGC